VDTNNAFYASIDGVLFDKDQATLLQFPGGMSGSYTIPSGVTTIGDQSFYDCTSLDSVTIPDSVTSISECAFYGLSLTHVTIGAGVANIGSGAFYACARLTAIYFWGDAPALGLDVFDDVPATVYYLPETIGWTNPWDDLAAVEANAVTVMGNPAQGGSVTGEGIYVAGTSVPLTATAANGWLFLGWSDGATNRSRSITVPTTNVAYTANFAPQYTWTTNDDYTITITGYLGADADACIPGVIDGMAVTSIEGVAYQSSTFSACTSLAIPAGVTNIGPFAFMGCGSLINLAIPATIAGIGDWAFCFCTSLGDITIPSGVSSMGSGAFDSCNSLTNVTIGYGVNSIAGMAFAQCSGLASIAIPASVTCIGSEAFESCVSLTTIAIPASVTNIGSGAFEACSGLTCVTIPGSVPGISDGLFRNCAGLASVTISNGVANIGNDVFDHCDNLIDVVLPESLTNIGDYAFFTCTNLVRVIIPDNVTRIGSFAFEWCSHLTSVQIGRSVASIGDFAFMGTRLTGLIIPDSVTTIGIAVFANCCLTRVTIPDSVASIGNGAFFACALLHEIYFQGNAPVLGSEVFDEDPATVYYLSGTTGWGTTFGGLPTVLWSPHVRNDATFGVHSNCFGFTITNAGSPTIVVDACTNLASPVWMTISTNTLTGGSSCFGDPQWMNYPSRFYRFRAP